MSSTLPGNGSRPTVHIVDDDEPVRDSLRMVLDLHGYVAREYRSAEEFTAALTDQTDACLVLDHDLPGTNGLAFLAGPTARQLRMPVIMLTVHADDALRAKAAQLGVQAVVDKPVSPDTLLAEIDRALGHSS